ncbi:AraC family transcriptional regulator [Bosea sp. 124]|uniref:AraC family transcriptional regulator n=1 Tax=Bosea sp. 124 TaxID=2135642 RepID=UPI000D3C4F23|nr:AraC family transcriptional regulator [Bosea sp. 124]PTM42222.1 AraC family transcriptional regulator [Bosea sp. 124]
MDSVSQSKTLGIRPLGSGERAELFLARHFDSLECLSATFATHAYAPHAHDTYVVGTIETGCEAWTVRGERHYGGSGDLTFINPLDVHDGEPVGEGYSYRMTYPAVALMQEIASSLAGWNGGRTPFFPRACVHDPEGAALLSRAHRAMEAGRSGAGREALGGEELLLRAYAYCLVRHAGVAAGAIGSEAGPIAHAQALMEARHDEELSLAEIAGSVGLPRHHLIRAFRRETGLTPHAWLVDVRVRRARDRLRRGEAPGDVAAATGFCDQAHLTRAFKARLGVTPGAFRAAHLS